MITQGFCEDILARHDFDQTEVKLLAKAWIEHEQELKDVLDWQNGARENAGALAVRLGLDPPDDMGDAALWHASAQAIKRLLDHVAELEQKLQAEREARKRTQAALKTAETRLEVERAIVPEMKLAEQLRKSQEALAKATETWTDDEGTVWAVPTAWAYAAACKALHRREEVSEALLAVLRREVEWAARATSPCARMPEYETPVPPLPLQSGRRRRHDMESRQKSRKNGIRERPDYVSVHHTRGRATGSR